MINIIHVYRANGLGHVFSGLGSLMHGLEIGSIPGGPSIPPSGYTPALDFSDERNSQYFPFFFK